MNAVNYFKNYNITPDTLDSDLVKSIRFAPMTLLKFYVGFDTRTPTGNKGWFEGFVLEDHKWHILMSVRGKSGWFPMSINKVDLFTGKTLIHGYKFNIYEGRELMNAIKVITA